MGAAIQTVLGVIQGAGGAGFEAFAPGSGDSFGIPSFPAGQSGYLEQVYGSDDTGPASISIKSARMHDNVRGILLELNPLTVGGGNADLNPQILLPDTVDQVVYSSDTLNVQGSAAGGDNVTIALDFYYPDLAGANADLATWEQLRSRIADWVGILVQPTAGAAGDYGTSVTLNSVDDRLKADTWYAYLGATSTIPCTSLGLRGPNTANYRVGCPLTPDTKTSVDWFVHKARIHTTPHIPILNANNKGATLVDLADAVGATAPDVTLIFAELN